MQTDSQQRDPTAPESQLQEGPTPNEIRAFRAAVEDTRTQIGIARGGAIGALICVYVANQFPHQASTLGVALNVLAPILVVGAAIPLLRAKCPKCKQRFQGLGVLFHKSGESIPCVSCSFDPSAHIPQYSR